MRDCVSGRVSPAPRESERSQRGSQGHVTMDPSLSNTHPRTQRAALQWSKTRSKTSSGLLWLSAPLSASCHVSKTSSRASPGQACQAACAASGTHTSHTRRGTAPKHQPPRLFLPWIRLLRYELALVLACMTTATMHSFASEPFALYRSGIDYRTFSFKTHFCGCLCPPLPHVL